MAQKSALDWIALVLVIIGAVNWGLVGLFGLDLVEKILGSIPMLAKIVYILVACVGCDKIEPEYEFGYKDGPSIERDADIGQMAVVRELGTSNTYPANVKMDYVNCTMSFKNDAYGTEPVKYEWAGNDKVVAKSSTIRNGKRVDYEATVFMER